MRQELDRLRELMKNHKLDYYLVPTTDRHGSEYVNDHYKCREFMTGFTGSAGTLLVSLKNAWLWTDGRYFLQADEQLAGSGIRLMKMGEPEVPELSVFLRQQASEIIERKPRMGFDGHVVSVTEAMAYAAAGLDLVADLDLVDLIWEDRPDPDPAPIYPISLEVTGESSEHKLARVREEMDREGADYLLLTSLEEIAWLYNLRGDDIEHTPVFFAYSIISRDRADLFVYPRRLKTHAETWANKETKSPGSCTCIVTEGDERRFVLREYNEVVKALAELPKGSSIWFSPEKTAYALEKALPEEISTIRNDTPVSMMKAIKNDTEIRAEINAHTKDGIAMVRFIHWLKTHPDVSSLNEIFVSDYLRALRLDSEECYDISFDTICGYGPNGAIIHYEATPESNAELAPEGFLLVDSGGQYEDGTTDITRTIALGPLSHKMKHHYTAVLKSHITLASAVFHKSTTGLQLDAMTRKPMNEMGLDYNHGTGHGVGHMLSVHEGPQNIGKRNGELPLCPGMICSDEPGVYIEGEFGVRLENEILCVEQDGDLAFRPMTFCPFDREAVLPELLSQEELKWLNGYHEMVYDVLSPLLPEDVAAWLKEQTAPIA